MKFLNKCIGLFLIISVSLISCTDLDQDVYSVVTEENFWQTQEQIEAGIAPAYQSLTKFPNSWFIFLTETTAGSLIMPTRGGDFYESGRYQELWLHTWGPSHQYIRETWEQLYEGVGRVNLSLNSIDRLEEKPEGVETAVAELKTLRAYYYYLLMDLYGNVPLVTDFETPPDSVSNSSRETVYDFLETELIENIPNLSESTDSDTYGRINKWTGYTLLAKLYLNSQVYTGKAKWQDVIEVTDNIINSGRFTLTPNFFDNFSPTNGPDSPENIFVVPFDKVEIPGNNWPTSLHYDLAKTFGLSGNPWNGRSAVEAFYTLFDTTSVYRQDGERVYRTYKDQRSGQWLIGQQYTAQYPYPPDVDVLFKAEDELKAYDTQTSLALNLYAEVETISSSESKFRLAGVRNIKYFPEAGASPTTISNDIVLFRYADILLMKAEAEARMGNNNEAADLINMIRERAYGNSEYNWSASDITPENILDERARELTWEFWRRQDMIRFEIADGKPYFTGARIPDKKQDSDNHYMLFPIPEDQIVTNPNLKQNPGY